MMTDNSPIINLGKLKFEPIPVIRNKLSSGLIFKRSRTANSLGTEQSLGSIHLVDYAIEDLALRKHVPQIYPKYRIG